MYVTPTQNITFMLNASQSVIIFSSDVLSIRILPDINVLNPPPFTQLIT